MNIASWVALLQYILKPPKDKEYFFAKDFQSVQRLFANPGYLNRIRDDDYRVRNRLWYSLWKMQSLRILQRTVHVGHANYCTLPFRLDYIHLIGLFTKGFSEEEHLESQVIVRITTFCSTLRAVQRRNSDEWFLTQKGKYGKMGTQNILMHEVTDIHRYLYIYHVGGEGV